MAALEKTIHTSIECVDNKDGRPGVVIYDDKTFAISSQQDAKGRTASGHIQGPYSSVRAFQFPSENEDTPMECDPPETACNAQTSNVAPPGSSTDEEVPMEVNKDLEEVDDADDEEEERG